MFGGCCGGLRPCAAAYGLSGFGCLGFGGVRGGCGGCGGGAAAARRPSSAPDAPTKYENLLRVGDQVRHDVFGLVLWRPSAVCGGVRLFGCRVVGVCGCRWRRRRVRRVRGGGGGSVGARPARLRRRRLGGGRRGAAAAAAPSGCHGWVALVEIGQQRGRVNFSVNGWTLGGYLIELG